MTKNIRHDVIIPDDFAGMRLDQALARLLPDFSRTQIQDWIKNGDIQVHGKPAKTRTLVFGGEAITVYAVLKAQPVFDAEPIALNIVHEDDDLLVINKP